MQKKYIDQVVFEDHLTAESYLTKLPVIRYLRRHPTLSFPSAVTVLVGENGTGKSTLLEAIAAAYGFNPEGGTKNFNFATRETHSELYRSFRLIRSAYANDGFFFRAESFYNVATEIEQLDMQPAYSPPIIASYGGRSLHEQSHGESFFAMAQNRFGGNGLYILDEPEAALSPTKQLALLVEFDRLVQKNSQLIIATHAPILMAFPGAYVYQISQDGIEHVSYKDTEHYRTMQNFLNDPEQLLHYLLQKPSQNGG